MKHLRIAFCALLAVLLLLACAHAEGTDLYAVDGEKLVIFDQDGLVVTLSGDYESAGNVNGKADNYMSQLKCVVENNTGKTIGLQYTCIVNGWNIDSYHNMNGVNSMPDGTKAKSYFWFTTEDCEVKAFEDLETMKATLYVKDENGKDLFKGETGTIHFHTSGAPAEEAPAEEAPTESIDAALADIAEAAPAEEAPTEEPAAEEPAEPARVYTTLDVGSKGDEVKELQQALIDQGFLSGKADGSYGKGTAGGVKKFQESVGLAATGTADEATQRKLYNDELLPVEIKLSGVTETDYMKIDGIFVDTSYKDEKNPQMTRLYLFYTAKTPDTPIKVYSKDSKLTFDGRGTYNSAHQWAACLYMPNYYYGDFVRDVYIGDSFKVADTFYVPKGELEAGGTMSFARTSIPDCEKLSMNVDDIISLPSAQEIAKVIDPEGYAAQTYALTEADKNTKNKVLKNLNGYYWDFWVDTITYRIDFGKYKYDQISKINGARVSTSGTYTICNGYIILENGSTHALIYVPYSWKDGDLILDIAYAFDWRTN